MLSEIHLTSIVRPRCTWAARYGPNMLPQYPLSAAMWAATGQQLQMTGTLATPTPLDDQTEHSPRLEYIKAGRTCI